MKANKHFSLCLAQFLSRWETLHTTVVQKIKTHILCSLTFYENRTVHEIMWKYIAEPGRPQVTIWRMRFECRIPKATNTYSGCVILIAFPVQQLHELASQLLCTHTACLVKHQAHNLKLRHVESLMARQSTKFRDFIIIIIIIIIIINCNWVVTRWLWLFYMFTKYEIGYY